MHFDFVTIVMSGNRGFTLAGQVEGDEGGYQPFDSCTPCVPGTPIHVGAIWIGTDFPAIFTLDGRGYNAGSGGGGSDNPSVQIFFNGPAVIAPPLRRRATLMTTFTMGGELEYPNP
jgi:hypothetical protein